MRKIIILTLLLAVTATGAFAFNFTLGASGALYMSSEEFQSSEAESILDRFDSGEGIYYGLNAELLFRKWGLGLYSYFSFYQYDEMATLDMMDVDVNLSLSYHLFRTTSFLDPFVEGGFGAITRDITAAGGTQFEEPITYQGTNYVFAGAGLGVNIGFIGAYAKLQYHMPTGNVEIDDAEYSYVADAYPLNDLKFILGGKLIF